MIVKTPYIDYRRINRAHPQAHELRALWKLGQQKDITQDLTLRNFQGTNTGAPAITAGISGYSVALSFNGSSQYITIADSADLSFGNSITDSPFSISAWVNITSATGFRICSKAYGDTNSPVGNIEYIFSFNGSGFLSLILYDDKTDVQISKTASTAGSTYVGKWIHVCATYDGSSTHGGIDLYVDGALTSASGGSVGTYVAMHNQASTVEIGRIFGGGTTPSYASGRIDRVSIYAKKLTASEVFTQYCRPNSLFTFYKYSYIASAATLSLLNLSSSQTLGNIDLTQANTLALTNTTSTQTLSTFALSTEDTLALANIAETQNLTNIDLFQANTLNTDSITKSQSLNSVDLIQQNILANNELTQSQVYDNINLAQQNTLENSNLNQIQTYGALNLIQQNTININNASQSVSLSNIDLLMSDILEMAHIVTSTSLTAIDLVQSNVIAVDNLLESNLLTIISVIQQHVLALGDLSSTSSIENINLLLQYLLAIDSIQSTNDIDNITLSETTPLTINNIIESVTLSNLDLTSSSILVVSSLLHSVITSNITLSMDSIVFPIKGNTIYMIGMNSNIYVLKDKKDIYFLDNEHTFNLIN